MLKRTVQKIGSSHAVIIPSNFVDMFGIKQGMEMQIGTSGDTIVMAPVKQVNENKLTTPLKEQ